METVDQLLETATERHRAGEFAEARRLYRRGAARAPGAHRGAVSQRPAGIAETATPNAALALGRAGRGGRCRANRAINSCWVRRCRRCAAGTRPSRAYEIGPEAAAGFPRRLEQSGNLPAAAPAICRRRRRPIGRPWRWIRRTPASWPTWARCCGKWASLTEAVELLRAAADLEPAVASHAVNLGIAYWNQGNFAEAERTLNQALARAPNDADAAVQSRQCLAWARQIARSHRTIPAGGGAAPRLCGRLDQPRQCADGNRRVQRRGGGLRRCPAPAARLGRGIE